MIAQTHNSDTTAYAYNLAGNVTQITYPSGRIVSYSYDSQGRISGVTTRASSNAPVVTLASGVTYEPFGPLASLTYGNGLVMTCRRCRLPPHRHHDPEQHHHRTEPELRL